MTYDRGDTVTVMYPNSDLRTAKRRPALVVQANNLNTELPQIVLAMISSNLERAGHPSRVQVTVASPEGRKSGLRTDSVIMTDNLATVIEKQIDSALGRLEDMTAVDAALRHTLGL